MASSKSNKNKAAVATTDDAAKQAAPAKTEKASKPAKAVGKGKAKGGKKDGKPGIVTRVRTYFKNVGVEVRRVVWPTKAEMVKYTGAVVGMLIFFGVLIAIVDAIVVPVLYAYSGLR